jgi:hypothetical protein
MACNDTLSVVDVWTAAELQFAIKEHRPYIRIRDHLNFERETSVPLENEALFIALQPGQHVSVQVCY